MKDKEINNEERREERDTESSIILRRTLEMSL